jgi:hypothetical protein
MLAVAMCHLTFASGALDPSFGVEGKLTTSCDLFAVPSSHVHIAIVKGANSTTGVGLVEVYHLQ